MMARWLRAFLAVAASVIGLTAFSAAPANAACTGSYFLCIYQYTDYDGAELLTSNSNTNWDYLGNPYAFRYMNDRMSSVKNTTGRTYATISVHDDGGGYDYCVVPRATRETVSDKINDKSSSHLFRSGC
ncbi:MAG: peptidase inhibitor family I36 protein [Nocardioides sp.]